MNLGKKSKIAEFILKEICKTLEFSYKTLLVFYIFTNLKISFSSIAFFYIILSFLQFLRREIKNEYKTNNGKYEPRKNNESNSIK